MGEENTGTPSHFANGIEEIGKGIDSTRPGRHLARLVSLLVETNTKTAETIEQLVQCLETSSKRAERLSKALVWLTFALAASTAVSAIALLLGCR